MPNWSSTSWNSGNVRKPENTFIASVHKLLPKAVHVEKMNNPYRSGCADVWYSGAKGDLWVEYKFIAKLPVKSDTVQADLSPLQTKWLRERSHEGRKVFVIIGSPTGGVILSGLAWENPVPLSSYLESIQTRQALAGWIASNTLGTNHDTDQLDRRTRNIRSVGTTAASNR